MEVNDEKAEVAPKETEGKLAKMEETDSLQPRSEH